MSLRPLRVLLCIPSDDIRTTCASALRERGYFVDEVSTGNACVHQALTSRIDVVIIDDELKDIDSYAVARKIREEDKRRRVRLIASIPLATTRDVTRSRSAGFDLIIAKPVRVAQIVVAMETLRSMASITAKPA